MTLKANDVPLPTQAQIERDFAFRDGFNALLHENKTGELVYNPHAFGPLHDAWDAGYQAGLDSTLNQNPLPK